MKKVAFLSMDNIGDFYVYDDLLIEPLAKAGWQVETISWKASNVEWSQFDAVIIRSPWDYQDDADAFLTCLENISQQTLLLNDLEVVHWNVSKDYLKDVQNSGVPIVPTLWSDKFELTTLQSTFEHFKTEELIIKPLVSANADDTYRIKQNYLDRDMKVPARVFEDKSHMLQPFVPEILAEGEYSLFYFGNEFSHGIRKVPKAGDFRVQEEHGGSLISIEPDAELLACAEKALSAIPSATLYARLDFVRYQQAYLVMELELIEPSLYFNMDKHSPDKFVKQFLTMV